MFLATCDKGSFAEAARSCGSDPSTVSKAISRLESNLKVTLFQRSTRQLRLTVAGKKYASTVRRVVQDLKVCEEELRQFNDSTNGTLRISSAVCYGHLYLRPLISEFCQLHPNIKLELEINDLHIDIIENSIDIALRTGFVKDSRLIARRLSPMDFLTCASPQYLATHGTPKCAEDFKLHSWIGFRIKETQQLQPIFLPNKDGRYQPFDLVSSHITDDGEAMAHMCADGLGFAQLPHFLAKRGLEEGSLVSLFPYFRPQQADSGVFVIYPKREYLPKKVRVFIDFLTSKLEQAGEGSHFTWAENLKPLVPFSE